MKMMQTLWSQIYTDNSLQNREAEIAIRRLQTPRFHPHHECVHYRRYRSNYITRVNTTSQNISRVKLHPSPRNFPPVGALEPNLMQIVSDIVWFPKKFGIFFLKQFPKATSSQYLSNFDNCYNYWWFLQLKASLVRTWEACRCTCSWLVGMNGG